MYNSKILAVIPARAGSKRLPNKNILPLVDKPLIAWTIESAIESKIFDEIMVSTDGSEIADIAKKFGATVPFVRSESLASDIATSVDVVLDVLQKYSYLGKDFDVVVLLQPTSPLRSSQDILAAIDLFYEKSASSLLSVCEVDHPSQWCNKLDPSLSMDNFMRNDQASRSQDFEKEYRINGAVYVIDIKKFLIEKKFIMKPSFAYVMPRSRSIDIDEEVDFKIASVLLDE